MNRIALLSIAAPLLLLSLGCWGPVPPEVEPVPDPPSAQPGPTDVKEVVSGSGVGGPRGTGSEVGNSTNAPPGPGSGESGPDVEAAVGEAGVADGSEVTLSRKKLERGLSRAESVGDVIGLRPHLTLRGMDGVKVTSIPKDSPLVATGLRKGDIIHAVNGQPLTSAGAALAAGEALQTADLLEGEISRNGKRMMLRVRLN